MTKMHNGFTKAVSMLVALSLLFTLVSVIGTEVQAVENKAYDRTTVLDEVNGMASGNNKLLYVGNRDYAVSEEDGSMYTSKFTGTPFVRMNDDAAIDELSSHDKWSVSFDIKAAADADDTALLSTIWFFSKEDLVSPEDPNKKESKGRLGSADIYKDRVAFSTNGSNGGKVDVTVDMNGWVNIEYVVYAQKDTDDKNIAEWYINGELKATGSIDQKATWMVSKTRRFNMMVPTDVPAKSLYFKNVRVNMIDNVDESQTFTASAFINENGNIEANFTEEIPDNFVVNSIKLYDKSGNETDRTVSLDSNRKKIIIVPKEQGELYTVVFPKRLISDSGLSLKKTSVTADGLEQIRIVDSNGADYAESAESDAYATAKLLNFAADAKEYRVIIAAYKASAKGLKMKGMAETTVGVPPNGMTVIEPNGENSLKLEIPSDADVIKAFMWKESDYMSPVKEKAEIIRNSYQSIVPGNVGIIQSGATEVSLAADFTEQKANSQISVYMTDKDGNCVYADQLVSDNSGKTGLYIDFDDDFETGEYTVRLAASDLYKDMNLAYVNVKKYDIASTSINEELNKEGQTKDESVKNIANILKTDYSFFGVDDALCKSADTDETALIVYNELSKDENSKLPLFGDNSFENMEKGSNLIRRFFVIAACGNGNIGNLFDYSSELDLKNDENYEWYTKEYVTKSVERNITSRMSAIRNYETQEQFYAQLKDSFILSIVKEPDGEDNLSEVLTNFASYIGIEGTLKASTLTALKGRDIKMIKGTDGLKSVIEKLEKESSETKVTPKPSGGSYSGGGMPSMKFDNTTAEKDEPQIIIDDIYDDLDGYDWAKQSIVYLAEKNIVNGKSENKFCPADLITREEFVAMLVRAFANNAEVSEVEFTDADKDAWYNETLGKAKTAGLINGYEDGRFGIGEKISRQDMVTMASRAAKFAGIMFSSDGTYSMFEDDNTIAEYAKDFVYELKRAGVVSGVSEKLFAPLDNAERAQAAKIIFELLNV